MVLTKIVNSNASTSASYKSHTTHGHLTGKFSNRKVRGRERVKVPWTGTNKKAHENQESVNSIHSQGPEDMLPPLNLGSPDLQTGGHNFSSHLVAADASTLLKGAQVQYHGRRTV